MQYKKQSNIKIFKVMEIDSEMFEIYSRVKAELGDLYKIRFEYDRFDINVSMKCYTGKGAQVRRWSCTYHRDNGGLDIIEEK